MVEKVTHEVRLQHWSRIVTACRGSGQTIKAWCAEHQINIKTYYYWQKRVCQNTCRSLAAETQGSLSTAAVHHEPIFAEVAASAPMREKIALTICKNGIQIHIHNGADAKTLETAFAFLVQLC
ncbi:MAG: IS66 family insertion sequence element accessory protein TnpB [Smithella sp.]